MGIRGEEVGASQKVWVKEGATSYLLASTVEQKFCKNA